MIKDMKKSDNFDFTATGIDAGVDIDRKSLGALMPPESPEEHADFVEMHGMRIPRRVVDAIRATGIPISQLNQGDLEAAIRALASDPHLIEDAKDTTFRGKLELTPSEIEARKNRDEDRPHENPVAPHFHSFECEKGDDEKERFTYRNRVASHLHGSHCEQLEEERKDRDSLTIGSERHN